VEHDEATIRSADHIIDLGPGAGEHGGRIVAEGALRDILGSVESLTGKYLRGELRISLPEGKKERDKARVLKIVGASEHNLKNIDVEIPLGLLVCVTGVSGSGKSTLVEDILYRALAKRLYRSREPAGKHKKIDGVQHIDKVIVIDQSPIGRTPRSNPATYTAAFSPIRDIFARLPESKVRGYKPGRFSFNVKGGRCEACSGDGIKQIEMHFLPDVYVQCEICKGRRFNAQTLDVKYKGRSISDVLDMSVEDAMEIFASIPPIRNKLKTLYDVGLGYIRLGQSATTLSGGEAQRIKLATELSKASTGRTLYILDEPTTGLHFADVDKLLKVLRALADQGNTVLVIEHNLDVIKTADHIIDLGPEGGDGGGWIVASGTPEEVAGCAKSYTGQYLKEVLK
jgi:excinuclease ABC subunit A